MRQSAILWGGAGVLTLVGAALIAGCPASALGECDDGNCDAPDGYSGGDGSTSDGALKDGDATFVEGGNIIDSPAGCTTPTDPGMSAPCVVDTFGVFVDGTNGSDTNLGTKASPYKTINGALSGNGAKLPNIFVCAASGGYQENVKLTSSNAVSIWGGFACGTWVYAGTNVVTNKPASGYAFEVDTVTSALTVADFELDAPDGAAGAVNSIAAFVHDSSAVTFKRATLKGGTGYQGVDQVQGAQGALKSSNAVTHPGTQQGNDGDANNGGAQIACTCQNGFTSKGGKGGDNVAGNASNGAAGETAQVTPSPLTATGAGQSSTDCTNATGSPKPGSKAPDESPAKAATLLGSLSSTGWISSAGSDGTDGQAGQGGGGGGANAGGGGSGGCGGCGGSKGLGGGGGGASVGLLSFNSTVTLLTSAVNGGQAGRGGAGGAGGLAQATSGARGVGGGAACNGGNGGLGGAGGAGSGGAGGIGAGILYKGTKPSYGIDSMVKPGTKGDAGTGGAAGTNDGPDGQGIDVYLSP